MSEIESLSINELLFDRQESFNDVISLLVAEQHGISDPARLQTNLNIINTITAECKRRGFDPAQFNQVKKAKND